MFVKEKSGFAVMQYVDDRPNCYKLSLTLDSGQVPFVLSYFQSGVALRGCRHRKRRGHVGVSTVCGLIGDRRNCIERTDHLATLIAVLHANPFERRTARR
jgi:hypothetical protein